MRLHSSVTQNLAYTWLVVAWIILTLGIRFLSPGQFSAPTGSSGFSLRRHWPKLVFECFSQPKRTRKNKKNNVKKEETTQESRQQGWDIQKTRVFLPVSSSGFRFHGSGFGVKGSGFRV